MPTGYTAGVSDGTITDFKEYALLCARAFGATIELREDPLSSDIPQFVPSDYHEKKSIEAHENLSRLRALSLAEIENECDELNKQQLRSYLDAVERNKVIKQRYELMLEKALMFVSPSDDHDEYATFLVTQLRDSMSFDLYEPTKPVELPPHEWYAEALRKENRDIAYHEKKYAEEVERTKQRNEWVNKLKESLNNI